MAPWRQPVPDAMPRRLAAADAASARPADADMMVACSICDLHLPASEAIFAHGRVYCCEAHQAQGKAAQSGQRLK